MNHIIFKKYIFPILFGVGLFLGCYELNSFLNLERRDLLGPFLFISIITIKIINRQIDNIGSISKLDSFFKYVFDYQFFRKKKVGLDIQKYLEGDSIAVSLLKTNLMISTFGAIIIIGFVIYTFIVDELYATSLVSVFFLIKVVFYMLEELKDNKLKIVIRKDGIVTSQLGFVKWEDMKLIQFRDTSTSETTNTNLDIFLTEKKKWKRPEFTIDIGSLDKSKEEIRMSIHAYSGYKHLIY